MPRRRVGSVRSARAALGAGLALVLAIPALPASAYASAAPAAPAVVASEPAPATVSARAASTADVAPTALRLQAPTSVVMRPGVERVVLRWAPPASGARATGYQTQMRRWLPGTRSWSSWATVRHDASVRSRVLRVADGRKVEGRVRALTSSTRGPWSPLVSARAGTPGVPGRVALSATGVRTAKVVWTAPTANSAPIRGYDVRRRSLVGGTWSAWTTVRVPATARSWTGSGLTVGTMEVAVRAVNRIGAGAYSSGRRAVVPGPAVKLVVTVSPPAGLFDARDVVVEARDAANNRATSYRGTVTFARSQGSWDIGPGDFPSDFDNVHVDVSGVIPADYSFTAADLGRKVFPDGWFTAAAVPWGLTVTDKATPSVTGRTRIDVPSEVRVTGDTIEARVLSGFPPQITQVWRGTLRDPRLHGATLEFYDAGAPDATSLPGPGGMARLRLPADGWEVWYPTQDPTVGFGWRYTGGSEDDCAEVIVAIGVLTARCDAGGLTGPLQGALQMWVELGPEEAGLSVICPQFGGSQLVRNLTGDIRTVTRGGWGQGEHPYRSTCLAAVDDEIYVVDPMSAQVGPQPASSTVIGQYLDEWSVDVLANDISGTPAALRWERDPASCVPDEAYVGGERCSLSNDVVPGPWGFLYPPGWGPDPRRAYITSQPDCGLFRSSPFLPSSGPFDGLSGTSCPEGGPLVVPYTVTDGLHTSSGRILVWYFSPSQPDLSSFDLDSRATITQTADGITVTDPQTGATLAEAEPGMMLDVIRGELALGPVVTIDVAMACPSCTGGILLSTMDVLQPGLAAAADPVSGKIQTADMKVTINRPELTVGGSLDGYEPSPFRPVITVNPTGEDCGSILDCDAPPPPSRLYSGTLYENLIRTVDDACTAVGGSVSSSGANWTCASVTVSAGEADAALEPFCSYYEAEQAGTVYGWQPTLTRAGSTLTCTFTRVPR